ncbi:hypothetical protein [Amycolatopsis minnesotensis]|uniref:hypothetical protein n=1 Tax=Amycolatopsis minnesotensis TaxID=337894 RepID=UPI0031DF1991
MPPTSPPDGERGREREARQRGNHHVQVREQRQDALEPQHRVRPAVQQPAERWWTIRSSCCNARPANARRRRRRWPPSSTRTRWSRRDDAFGLGVSTRRRVLRSELGDPADLREWLSTTIQRLADG